MYWEQLVQSEAQTDIGLRRKNNEDAYCIHVCQQEDEWRRCGHLFVVADGMGGHAVGELASRLAIETVPHTFLKTTHTDPRKSLHEAIIAANQAIHSCGTQNADFLHMGTTCTVLTLTSQGAIIGHVGDSRVYRIRRDRIDQLTFDHSLEWELERQHGSLEGLGDLSRHRNIITRSLGPEEVIDVDIEGPFPILPGDMFVLCSDGLSNQVDDPEIGAIVRELSPKLAARLLIHLANIRGGPDNSTALVVHVGDLPANVPIKTFDEEFTEQGSLSWGSLIGFCMLAFCLVFSFAMLFTGHPIKGSILLSLTLGGLIIFLVGSFRRSTPQVIEAVDESRTRIWRPHRTAVGLSSQDLSERLKEIDHDIQRAAREDGWEVNWDEHERMVNAGNKAIEEKRYVKAIRDYARSICLIMDQLPRASLPKKASPAE